MVTGIRGGLTLLLVVLTALYEITAEIHYGPHFIVAEGVDGLEVR